MTSKTTVFIGSGNMASSLIGGLVADGHSPDSLIAADPDTRTLNNLAQRFGIRTTTDNRVAAEAADIVVLSVKPQLLQTVARQLGPVIRERRALVISIAAGIREKDLQLWLGGDVAMVRVMPNTPALIQAGASALHAGPGVTQAQRDLAESILRAVGVTLWVERESMLDAVTAVSGSGPAYYFLVMECMEAAAIEMGLDSATAHLLVLQTALGAAKMAIESSDSPAVLRQKVTSPGGTTEKALRRLTEEGLPEIFRRALQDARDRAVELSRELAHTDG
jgi:pyrroline-5-carboxylate reductase